MRIRYVIYLFTILCLLFTLVGCGGREPVTFGQTEDAVGESATQTEESLQKILVDVCGAVHTPGVYAVPADARVYDAIAAAGGFTGDADSEQINQARPVCDGEQIRVPVVGEEGAADDRVNINTASEEELMTLSGIGAAKAADIIAYRKEHGLFQKPEELMEVPGIKEGLYQRIKDKIRI